MTFEMLYVMTVLVFSIVLVIFNIWRVDIAALFMIVSLGLGQYLGLGLLGPSNTPQDTLLAISGFSQPVAITLIGLFILSQTLTYNNVMIWLGQRIAAAGRKSESRFVFLFTSVSALLSLMMNNITVGALLLPSIIQTTRRTKIKVSKLLIPVAFGTALGGMATYFTTANIVLSNLLSAAKPPQQSLGILSFGATGGLIAIAGILYIATIGHHLVPVRQPGPLQAFARRDRNELENLYSLGDRVWEARLDPKSVLKGKTLKQTHLGEKYGLAVIAIWRGKKGIFTPHATDRILPNDVLLIVGREARVSRLTKLGLKIGREPRTINHFVGTLIELILSPHSAYEGRTIKQLNFRRKYGFTVVALLRRNRSYRTDVGDIPLEMGDSLLMIGLSERIRDLRLNPDIIILEPEPSTRAIPRRGAIFSIMLFVGTILLAFTGMPVYLAVLIAALLAILLGLLPIQEVYRSIEWQVIFFTAGMYATSFAMVHTGLASLMGTTALDFLGKSGALGLASGAFLLSAGFTQFIGSQAAAFVVGPIAISAAIHLQTNPQAIAVASAIGCSASFLTPFAHPVNLIMMSPGNYRFGDFFRIGIGLMLVTFLTLLAGMVLFWKL